MKNHVLTFSAFLLLGIALYASPASAFVTTDVAEGAGRVVATVGDTVRAGGVELEKLEHKIFGEKIFGKEGTKFKEREIEKYMPKTARRPAIPTKKPLRTMPRCWRKPKPKLPS